jgi:predicted MPP superfamily phosphohydrolase
LFSRRQFLSLITATGGFMGMGSYAFAYEPRVRLEVVEYAPRPANWPATLGVRIAVLTDIHIGGFTMPPERLEEIVAHTNALEPDLVLLLGDYVAGYDPRHVPLAALAASILGRLRAPLGIFGVLGNHDWWDDKLAQARRDGPTVTQIALERVGIRILENDGVKLLHQGRPFWVLGLGDALAFHLRRGRVTGGSGDGRDDIPKTIAVLDDDSPAILMAHEPDVFPDVPDRVALTLSGHTHGGQVRLLGWSPIVPSQYGNRYAYGMIVEDGRHLIVSGGLGTGMLPVRFGMPPEIVLVTLGQPTRQARLPGAAHLASGGASSRT